MWLVPFAYEVSKYCCGIFDIWIKIAPRFFQQIKKIGPRVSQWRPKSVQGVPPRCSEKQVTNKSATAGINQATGSKMGANIWKFAILWVIFSMLFRIMLGMDF